MIHARLGRLCLRIALTFVLLCSGQALAATATIAWDYSATGAAGFAVYCGTASGRYTTRLNAGNTQSYSILNLAAGTTYYCVVVAYDSSQVESPYSNELRIAIPAAPAPTPTPTPTPTTPVVNFSGSPLTGTAPLTVSFSNTTTGTIATWLWNFGDGTTSTARTPSHTYAAAGTYTVTLTARTSAGTAYTRTLTGYVRVSAPPPPATVKPGLVAAYGFNEGTGTRINDLSGKANTGTTSNLTWAATGRYGRALNFPGNGWVTVNDSASLQLTNRLTIEAWVYPTSALNRWAQVVMKERSGGASYYLAAGSDRDRAVAGLNIGGERMLVSGVALPLNRWSHLATTYDGTYQRLYINGSLIASRTQTGAITAAPGPLRIGGNSIWGEYFRGMIDEVRIYNRALSGSEIMSDMNTAVR